MRETKDNAFIWSYLGKELHAFNLKVDDVDIIEIAHAQSMTCRFGGHIKRFYSVAEHSVIMSYLAEPEDALAALLHDGEEYIVTDVPSPIKKHMPEHKEISAHIQGVVEERFNVTIPEYVHELDHQLVVDEAKVLFLRHPSWIESFPFEEVGGAARVMIKGFEWRIARYLFLRRFDELINGDGWDEREFFEYYHKNLSPEAIEKQVEENDSAKIQLINPVNSIILP